MTGTIEVRDASPDDRPAIEALYAEGDIRENLVPLVLELLSIPDGIDSLVATIDGAFAGHMIVTESGIDGSRRRCVYMGPIAVLSKLRNRGVGAALVAAGLRIGRERYFDRVLVLGNPGFYGHFGFAVEKNVLPPYPLPEAWKDLWQSFPLATNDPEARGTLTLPKPWLRPHLWSA